MELHEVESDIFQYLRDELGVAEDLTRDDPLFTSGAIDSFDLLQILAFVKEHYSLEVPPLDVSLENFDTVARMGALVVARTAA